MAEPLPDALDDATASTVLVYLTLREADQPLSYDALVERTNRHRRTVREATTTLDDLGLAERQWVSPQTVGYVSRGGRDGRKNGG